MIISFHGTQKRGHNVGAIAVFAAALESFRTNRKTCMISLRNNIPGENIENFAIPGEESSDDMLNNFSFSDIGIDGLLRRAEIGRLQPEQFDNCVTPLVREKNGFDIIRATKETRLEEALNSKWQFVEEILATANKIYDYVFVYIGSTDNEVVKKMNELSDKVVLVVRQGKREPFPEADKDPAIQKKLCLLVTDFESESVWNFKHIKTEYNIKKNIFTMPHNVKFRDAREDGGLVRFAMKNVNPNRNDFNSFLIYSVKRLLKFCDGNETDAVGQYTPKYEELEDPLYKEISEAKVLEPYAAEATTETFTEKAGFFSRPKEKTVVKLTEDASQEVARESDQNLTWKPTNASEQATKLQKEVKVYTERAEQIALKKAANRMITAPVEEPEEITDNDYDKMFRFADDNDDENENEEQEEYEEAAVEEVEEDTAQAAPEVPAVSEKPVEKPIQKVPVKEVVRERPIKKEVPHVEPLNDASEVDIPVEDDIEESEDDIIPVPDEDEDPEAVDETDGIKAEETEVSEEADEEAEDEVSDDDFFIDDIEDDNVAPEADESEDVEDTEDDVSEDDFFADDDSDEFINEETDSEVDETEDTDDFDESEDPDDTTEGNFDDFDEAEDDFTDETEDESDISESLEDGEETENDFDDTSDDFEDSDDDSDEEDVVSYSLGSAADTALDDEAEDTFEDFDDSDEEEEDYVPEASYVLKDDDHKSEMYDTEDTDPVTSVKKQNAKNNLGSEFAWLMDETDDEESDDSYEDDDISNDAGKDTDAYEDDDYSDISEDEGSYNEDDETDNTDDDIDDFDSYEDDDVVTDEDDNAPDDDMGFDEPVEDEEVDAVEDTVDADSGMTKELIEKVASLYDDGYRLDMIAKMVGESEDTVRNIRNLSRTISDDYHDGFRLDKIAKRNGISVELAEVLNDTAKQFA